MLEGEECFAAFGVIENAEMPQQHPLKVAGPHQLDRRRQQEQQETVEKMFPHIAAAHQQIRNTFAVVGVGTMQPKLMKAIRFYKSGCSKEYEKVNSSTQKCRRLARSMSRTMDLLRKKCSTFEDSAEYVHHMSELVAIYVSCELRSANEFKEDKSLISNRICENIYKYLQAGNEEDTKSNILRMFVYMPKMHKEREVMTKIFQFFIPKEQVILQRELPDKLFIQYLIVFYHWKELESDVEEQLRVIEFANKFMRPAETLCANSIYAKHLPKYESRRKATKFVLQKLEFFQDLRRASIYDNQLHFGLGVIDLSDEDELMESPVVYDDFASIVQNVKSTIKAPPIKLEMQLVTATIDLTLDDDDDDEKKKETGWLETLKANVTKLELSRHALTMLAGRTAALTGGSKNKSTEIVNLIDSDSDLDLEEPEQISSNYLDLESEQINSLEDEGLSNSTSGDNDSNGLLIIPKIAAAKEDSSTTCSTVEKSLTPSKILSQTTVANPHINSCANVTLTDLQQTQINPKISEVCNSTTALSEQQSITLFTMPRIVDSYPWRRNSIHISSSPTTNNETDITSADRNSNSDEIETDGECTNNTTSTKQFNSSKVIFSQTPASRLQQDAEDFDVEDIALNTRPSDIPNQKKQVKFNDNLIVSPRATNVQHPIKPAIKTTKHISQQSTTIFSTSPLQRFGCPSPASSTSSYSEKLKQIAEKEHIAAVPTVFSKYGLFKNNDSLKKTSNKNAKKTSQFFSKSVLKNIHHRQHSEIPLTCQVEDFSSDFKTAQLSKGALKAYPVKIKDSFNIFQSLLDNDEKLKKKCCVTIERNDVLEEHERGKAAYINKLLQIQREKRKQALEKKQRRDEKRQRLLQEKAMEAKRITDEIQELRRQQEEKIRFRAEEEQMLRVREKELHDRLLKEKLRSDQLEKRTTQIMRKELKLLKLREKSTATVAEVDNSAVSTTVSQIETTKTALRRRSNAVDERCFTSSTKDFTDDSIMKQGFNFSDSEEVCKTTLTESSVQKEIRSSTPEKLTTNELCPEVVKEATTLPPSMQSPKVSKEKIVVSPISATKPLKVRLKRLFNDKSSSVKATEETQEQRIDQDNVEIDTTERERMLKTKNKLKNELKAQLEEIEYIQKENSEINHAEIKPPNSEEMKDLTSNFLPNSSFDNKCQESPIPILKENILSETPAAVAEAASSLALLANTAAKASIAEMNTNNNIVQLPSEKLDIPKPPIIVETTILKTTNAVVVEEEANLPSTQKLPTLYRISDIDNIVTETEEDIRKESNLRLINFEATPTVPTYLFNGESRDVPTPTPPPLSTPSVVPVTFESAIAAPSTGVAEPEEAFITTTATNNANNLTLSTSDHEVSSTQETLCESLKRNASHLIQTPPTALISTPTTTTIPVTVLDPCADAALVQNNQVDTTHHLPENNTNMRRRTRKLSAFDESARNANVEHIKQRQQSNSRKRRKTICAGSTYQLQSSAVEINFSGNATSPSTTTNPLEKLPSRRRGGRTAKLSSSAGSKTNKKSHRSDSISTPPNAATEDTAGRALRCNSPGVLSLVDTEIKHTYSKNNSVQNVFVPPEIEKCLEQETHDATNMKTSAVSVKALKIKKTLKRNVVSAAKEKDNNSKVKTFKGAKMKSIDKPSANKNPVALIGFKANKVESPSKPSVPALSRRKKR